MNAAVKQSSTAKPSSLLKEHAVIFVFISLLAVAFAGLLYYRHVRQPLTLTGSVIVRDADVRKQLPIAGVEITLKSGLARGPVASDASGLFSLRLFKKIRRGDPIVLQFRHANYEPLDVQEKAQNELYVVHMTPVAHPRTATTAASVLISNVRARYTTKTRTSVNVGSEVKTFEVQNVGNVPCGTGDTCSPDGEWKAALGSITIDAGQGNEFRNARISCIAGPCPFTRIDSDDFANGGQKATATARDWSDTTTFLVEAEVFHTMGGQSDYRSYPVIFGTALSFTLPPRSEGVSLEADVGGQTIIYPIGPDLLLSWANCSSMTRKDETTVFRCELKPGYRFQ